MKLNEALDLVNQNIKNGWWTPLKEPARTLVRNHYLTKLQELNFVLGKVEADIFNKGGTLISNGYERIVIGDYGPYIEFDAYSVPDGHWVKIFEIDDKGQIKHVS